LNKVEFYYSVWNNEFDIKGVVDKEHPLLTHICSIIKLNEKANNKELIFKNLQKLRLEYLERKLPIEYYREINPNNTFKFLCRYASFVPTQDEISKELLPLIDISFNYVNFIIPLISILI
jgi:hypothetical protein